MVELRDYQAQDYAAVLTLVHEVIDEHGLDAAQEHACREIQTLGSSPADGLFKVMTVHDRIIGCYGLRRGDPGQCELQLLYLDAEYRGRGLGKRMLTDALAEARRRGYAYMTLQTHSAFQAALALYLGHGFETCERVGLADTCNLALRRSL